MISVRTYSDLSKKYNTENKCLKYIFTLRFGHIKDFKKYYKVKGRNCFAHSVTGKQIYPLANTIFHRSTTPLTTWFYIIYLFSVSKNGMSSYEIQRLTGVTYKTAWRMGKKIRELFDTTSNLELLKGEVEADETYIGGKNGNKHYDRKIGTEKHIPKTIVLGAVARNGNVVARVADDTTESSVKPFIRGQVSREANLYTDENPVYFDFKYYLKHKTVNHSKKQFKDGRACTNTIEGFWSQLKRSIDGTHHMVSPKHLQMYVNEFVWKYNHRKVNVGLFEIMMGRV